jgi:hypothetical protein
MDTAVRWAMVAILVVAWWSWNPVAHRPFQENDPILFLHAQ